MTNAGHWSLNDLDLDDLVTIHVYQYLQSLQMQFVKLQEQRIQVSVAAADDDDVAAVYPLYQLICTIT